MRNRPNTKGYRRNRRAKWSNPLFVWLFVFLATLICVPIQAKDHKPEPQSTEIRTQAPEENTPEDALYETEKRP